MGQGDPGRQYQAAGMKPRPKIGKTFHNVSLGEPWGEGAKNGGRRRQRGPGAISANGPPACISPAVLQDLVGKSVHGRFGISGVELCDNYHTLPLWCGTALVRCACRDGLSASGLVERFRSRAGGASPFAALCGRMSNLYPTPGTERMNRGAFGSGSILRRRRATSISTLRS